MSPLITALIAGGIAAGVGAAAAGITTHIKNLSEGITPWDDPKEWFQSEFKSKLVGGTSGFATGALGSVIGPVFGGTASAVTGSSGGASGAVQGAAIGGAEGGLGGSISPAVGEAVSSAVGSNIGSVPVSAGAASPTSLGGVLTPDKLGLLGAIKEGTPSTLLSAARGVAKNTISSALVGAATNPRDPGRGALIGAAGGAASSAVQGLGNVAFRGSGASFVDGARSGAPGYSLAGSGDFSRVGGAYNPGANLSLAGGATGGSSPYTFGLRAESPSLGPVGQQALTGTSRVAGSAARMGMTRATAPRPPINPNPYAATPYAAGSNYWRRLV